MANTDGRPSILVVDDSRVVLVSVTRILEHEFNVYQARDGEEGLDSARSLKPGLIISDIMMPKLDGYGLICALRGNKDSQLSDAPIIVITGSEEEYVRERAYACGANAFINKPFDATTLLNSVKTHLIHADASSAELSTKYDDRIESLVISDIPVDPPQP